MSRFLRSITFTMFGLIAVLLPGPAAPAYTMLDFVMFDGVEYVRWTDDPGRPLEKSDLADEFAVVSCSVADEPQTCRYGADATAGFMPGGTRVYMVRDYKPEFRLAAVSNGRVFLYQAWRSRRAKIGGDLYDIVGKIRAIDVRRGEPVAGVPPPGTMITKRADLDALVDMLVHAPVRPVRARTGGAARYWLTFWLEDGTTLGRAYFVETGDLTGGVVLPPEFRSVLERYLSD